MNHSQPATDGVSETLTRIRQCFRWNERQVTGCTWIEGIREFIQAYDAHYTFETVIYSKRLQKSSLAEMLVRRLVRTGVRRVRVTPEQFREICRNPRASGIGAIVRQQWTPLDSLSPSRGLCWLIVEQLRSSGNFGTILRTANATGVSGIICVGPACDPFDPVVIRTSMGGIFHLPFVRTTCEELAKWVQQNQIQLVGLSPDASAVWTDLPISAPMGLVIGEERRGLSEQIRALCHSFVRLPMTSTADSLNVGVATGIMLYELIRRSQTAVHANHSREFGVANDE
jgi:TrmH family RNA methyltransferase